MNIHRKIISALTVLMLLAGLSKSWALQSGEVITYQNNQNLSTSGIFASGGNIGIGTSTPQGGFVVTNGNIGVGTWAPTQVLDVKGNISATGTITGATISGSLVPSSLEVTGQAAFNTSSGNTGIGTTLTGGNTAKLAVIGGNVGIGTITPQGGLVVTNGNVGIGTWAPAAALQVGKYVSSNNGFVVDATGNVGIGTVMTTTAAMTVMSGNIGVGTWAPWAQLQVLGSIGAKNGGIYSAANSFKVDNAYGLVHAGGLSTGYILVDTTHAAIRTAGTTAIYVDSSSYVGIGTVNPSNQLTVNGGVGIGTASSAYVNTSVAPAGGMIVQGNVGLGTTSPQTGLVSMNNVGIGTWTAAGGRVIVQGGNVGIGTIFPQAALEVSGSIVSRTYNAGSSTTIDWNNGNQQFTSASCGAFTFSGMKDGGSYVLLVQGTTSGTCSFSNSDSPTLAFRLPSNHGATTNGTMTVYNFLRLGTYVIITWLTGYST